MRPTDVERRIIQFMDPVTRARYSQTNHFRRFLVLAYNDEAQDLHHLLVPKFFSNAEYEELRVLQKDTGMMTLTSFMLIL